jgi:transposase InsO family protein
MSDDLKISITKLVADGSNWVTYRDRMLWAIDSRGLSEHLTNATITATYTAVGTVGSVTPQMRWSGDQAMVKQLIAISVPDTVFNRIKTGTTAKDVWDALRKLYEGRTMLITIDLGRRLQTMRCGEDESVREHFERLGNMREQLAAMGKLIADEEYASILMGSLPALYAPTLSGISAAAEISATTLTVVMVTKLAIDEYDRRTLGNTKSDEAFAVDAKRKGKKRDVECFNCHKRGHMKADCWAKGGGKEGQGPRRRRNSSKDGGKKADTAAGAEQAGDKSAGGKDKDEDVEAWAVVEEEEDEDEPPQIPAMAADEARDAEVELFDSGASRHMSPFRERFVTYRDIPARPITAANNRAFYAVGMGDLEIDVPNGASSTKVLLCDALYAPDLGLTVVSIGRIVKAGCTVEFEDGTCRIKRNSNVIGNVPASANGLFKVDHALAAAESLERVDILTLHRRLGHIALNTIRTLVRNKAISGIHLIDDHPPFACDSCEYAKTTRKPIQKQHEGPQATAFGDEIHSDVWGASTPESLGGRKYYVTFTDDYSRYSWIEPLRTKDETFGAYKTFAAWAKTQHGMRVKRLRSDHGGEYTGRKFSAFLRKQGTERHFTTHGTPQHNGVAESLNCRLFDRVRAMLHQADMPKNLWAEAVRFAVWLKNRTSTKAIGNVTPYERLYNEVPNLGGVPEWGQHVWVYNATGSKLDARANQARWVGYNADSTHAHRIYWPSTKHTSVECNVKFVSPSITVHSSPPSYTSATQPAAPQPALAQATPQPSSSSAPPAQPPRTPVVTRSKSIQQPPPAPHRPGVSTTIRPATPPSPLQPLTPSDQSEEEHAPAPSTPVPPRMSFVDMQIPRRSGRIPVASAWRRQLEAGEGTMGEEYSDYVFSAAFDNIITAAILDVEVDPKSLAEAQSSPNWPRWKEAMDRELTTLEKAGTWVDVPRPSDKNIVGSKWVYCVKRKADGSVDKYKARLVARGFTQIYRVDYFTTFSPVAKLSSFCTILAIAARHDWEIESFDFNAAYLNGELDDDEEIYMHPPPGYDTDSDFVKRLRKALYGLKQAGRKWYDTLLRALADIGFSVSQADPGVFIAKIGNDILILAVHVDDCVFTGSSALLITEYKEKINSCYAFSDLGPINWLLGIRVMRNRAEHTISLSQTAFIDSILSCFALTDAKPCASPMIPGFIYTKDHSPSSPEEAAQMKKTPYREAIGSLMYVAVAMRPDIAFAVSALSQFLSNPGRAHWEAVKHIFKYLSGTKTLELTYGGERHGLEGYTDADGATQEHRHAMSGYAFLIDGGAVSWSSRKQELVTLSTAEAEYVAATHAAKEAIWLCKLIGELFPNLITSTPLHCDNQAALKLATDDNYHARTKHIDIRYHFIRHIVATGALKLSYCPTEDMLADIFTKALPKWKVAAHVHSLGMCNTCRGVMEYNAHSV